MDAAHPGIQSHDRPIDLVYPPSRPSEATQHLTDAAPPSLRYDIASKKRSIAAQWTMIILCNAIVPLILYFSLRHRTSLNKKVLVTITEITMISSVFNWPYRLWQLLRRDGERAPRDKTIFTWDTFQWSFLIDIPIMTAFCVVASIQGSLRILAIGPVVLFGVLGLQGVLSCVMCSAGIRTFCRLSSLPARSVFRPIAYAIIEDITAVDGAGGQEYRIRLNRRYEASPPFQQLVYNITLCLGIGFLVHSGVQIAVLVTTSDEVSFVVSTGILWVWAGISALWGVYYASQALKNEKLWWKQQALAKRTSEP